MFKRPKPDEEEDDILRMQEEFLREKNKHQNIYPAAQVVNLRPKEPQATKRLNPNEASTRKPSKYAQSKGLKNHTEKRLCVDTHSGTLMGDILEKNIEEPLQQTEPESEDDKVYYPKVIPSLLGNIVEKNVDKFVDISVIPMPLGGFPVATKRNPNISHGTKSIHTLNLEKVKQDSNTKMDIDMPSCSQVASEQNVLKNSLNLPTKSYLLKSKEAEKIHNENVEILNTMTEKEILEEQQKLLTMLDPKLIEFIKAKRNQISSDNNEHATVKDCKNIEEKMEICESQTFENDSLWENDVLSHPNVDQWINFDSFEKDKLEWMRGIEESKKINPNKSFEARFDFKGYLMPYTIEYTEKTKTLFHHGEEPHRPGYSLTELFELSRSTITQQRIMALNTLAGVLDYYNAGTYKDIIEIPLSKIFFVLRFAMDENKVNILEPVLKAMRNLFYNRIDEASLDALIGFEAGSQQPCLENDKSEIEELESIESELQDFHLAEIDIISAALRTDIIQRLYYILETLKPSFNCVHYALQILTRLARDSVETANKIVQTYHLMSTIVQNFVPITAINFMFEPPIVYNGKPVLAALKLIRVLCLQSRETADILISKYDILNPISEYISTGVEGTYGLRVQIESYSILSNLLHYNNEIERAKSLFPIIITTLHKHVQGTDIFFNSSIISATHAAVVLQLINKLLICNLIGFESSYYNQICNEIREGVQKWLSQLCHMETYTCGHLRILCSVLDCCKTLLMIEKKSFKFLEDLLKIFSKSVGYQVIVKQILLCSNLLSGIENHDLHLTKNLMSLRATIVHSGQVVLPTLKIVSPLPFLASLFKLLEFVDKTNADAFIDKLTEYLNKLSVKMPSLCDNWFTRIETDFVFCILKISVQNSTTESQKDLIYAVANKLCYILRIDKKSELEFLFNNIVFNKQWFTAERLMSLMSLSDTDGAKVLTSIENVKRCYSKVINLTYKDTGPNMVLKKWQEPILPRDWIYLPILNLYSESQDADTTFKIIGEHANRVAAQVSAEKEFIISCSLQWILFNELCFSNLLNDISTTDRFCRLMCVFLCDNSLFLEGKINVLLQKCVLMLFEKEKKKPFNFNKPLVGLNNFQDFYTQFLEQFQSVSYGDHTFAACVLVPLAQKHDMKWRKLLWSEYAGCLRALDCPKELLCYDMKDYLYPEEMDDSLIKSYYQALNSNLLRPGSIVHKIACHHVQCFKKRSTLSNR